MPSGPRATRESSQSSRTTCARSGGSSRRRVLIRGRVICRASSATSIGGTCRSPSRWENSGIDPPTAFVATLPHSAAHAVFFTLGKSTADFCPALVGALKQLGGVPQAAVIDNDSSIVVTGCGRRARLHDEVAALFGHLGIKPIVLEARRPESKGQGERTIGYLESSFLPVRSFGGVDDLQGQHDAWAKTVAYQRHHRRVGAKVVDAWNVERGFLSPLPDPVPDTDRRLEVRVQKDGFVRVYDVDYSVPPGLGGRRVQVRTSLTEVVVYLEAKEIARHPRSYVPADVILDPAHARALRLARDAKQRLAREDVDVSAPDLSVYDHLVVSP